MQLSGEQLDNSQNLKKISPCPYFDFLSKKQFLRLQIIEEMYGQVGLSRATLESQVKVFLLIQMQLSGEQLDLS